MSQVARKPFVLSIESSCDETGIAVIEDGRRIRSNVVASQVALHAPSGGIVPEVAARAHLRWIVPVLDAAWADAGVTWPDIGAVAVTYGPGLAGSLLVGINFAKAIAWVHDLPLIGVNHLEGHVYAAWLHDATADEREDPVFPLVALVVSGGHTFLVEMRDHLTYRLLGSTVDDAAGEAFDKVGRLLGLGYPGGPAISRAADGATNRDRVFPRAWLGDTFDFSFSGLKTAARRIVTAARADEGLSPDPGEALPEAVVAELRLGLSGCRGGRPGDQDDPGGNGRRRAVDRPGRRRGGERRPPGPAGRRGRRARDPAGCAAAGPVHGQRGDDRGRRCAALRDGGADRARARCPPVASAGRSMNASAAPRIDASAVRATLRAAGLRAQHRFSQNFLADPEVLEAILIEADPRPARRIVEIGPGLGILTGGLLAAGATVTAVELDRGLAAFLRERFADRIAAGELQLINGDALDQDLVHLVEPPYDVVANLPYHITSPILHVLLGRPPRPGRLVLMVQHEVAERIAAPPGKMSYLSVFVQYHARVRIAFSVPPTAFEPEPAVESAVIVVEPYDADDRLEPDAEDELWRLVQAAFRERRKMIHNVLSRQLPLDAGRVTSALATARIEPDRRPQTLAVGEWLVLREALGPIGPDRRGVRRDPPA